MRQHPAEESAKEFEEASSPMPQHEGASSDIPADGQQDALGAVRGAARATADRSSAATVAAVPRNRYAATGRLIAPQDNASPPPFIPDADASGGSDGGVGLK